MSEDITTPTRGSVPGRLIITLAPKAAEATRERIAATRVQRVPAVLRGTGIDTLDAVLKKHGALSTRPATGLRRFERLVRVRMDRRLIAEFPEKADLGAIAAALCIWSFRFKPS